MNSQFNVVRGIGKAGRRMPGDAPTAGAASPDHSRSRREALSAAAMGGCGRRWKDFHLTRVIASLGGRSRRSGRWMQASAERAERSHPARGFASIADQLQHASRIRTFSLGAGSGWQRSGPAGIPRQTAGPQRSACLSGIWAGWIARGFCRFRQQQRAGSQRGPQPHTRACSRSSSRSCTTEFAA